MKKLKGVCLGAGYFSQFHFEAWNRINDVHIIGLYDRFKAKAETAAEKFKIDRVYNSIEEVFEKDKPDFIDIISPPDTHYELCELAIKNNVHIICQKPLAPTLTEAHKIAALLESNKVRMMVHENFRFQPWHREIKKLLNANTIGKPHAINLRMRMGDGWQSDAYMNRQPYFREMEKLLIYETGIHFIDVFRYLIGEVDSVYAKLKTLNQNIKGEDFAWVHINFENGALGFIDANRYNENTVDDPRLTFGAVLIEGDKGSLRLNGEGKITVQLLGKKEKQHNYTFYKKNFAGDCVYHTQLHFVQSLKSNEDFETDITDYLKNMAVQDAIYKSFKTGGLVKL
ncbi:Gfo/Idh/MocA family protein [Croceitalea marina]|uniref:Gfo/Idh/MocA family protein n=1 Tax=Croceitalea marina TaxID=1775166 RepID=A0ABW5MVH2_9FLAO